MSDHSALLKGVVQLVAEVIEFVLHLTPGDSGRARKTDAKKPSRTHDSSNAGRRAI